MDVTALEKTLSHLFKIAILICAAIYYFCPLVAGAGEGQTVENNVIKLTREDSGKEISLKVGDTVEIALPAPGAAGYMWYFDHLDQEYLEPTGEESRVPSRERLTGAPFTKIWKLRAKKEGETEMNMSLYRVWEGKEKAIDRFEIKVRIS